MLPANTTQTQAPASSVQVAGERASLVQVHALVGEYAHLVRERFGKRVSAIWLYGSAARGDWTAESDIDVLVLLHNEEDGDMEWLVATAYRIGLAKRHLLLQPVMLTKAEFDRLAARERRFALDILREGRTV
jgi:predicted nucleotidyltransferase